MSNLRVLATAFAMTAVGLFAQPANNEWPSYNGDLSGRRFSPMTKINSNNVGGLTLAWMYRLNAGQGASAPRATPLMADGVIYLSSQDNAFAIDAHTGRELWHYVWASTGARHFSNRGMGM